MLQPHFKGWFSSKKLHVSHDPVIMTGLSEGLSLSLEDSDRSADVEVSSLVSFFVELSAVLFESRSLGF